MISKATPVCPSKDLRHAPNEASSFLAGIMTETSGRVRSESEVSIGRIVYYKSVRRSLLVPILFAFGLLAGCYHGSRPPRIGTPAPDFMVKDGNQTVTLSQLQGQIVVLNFWATWCAPCVEEIPSLVSMSQKMKPKGVTVLGVSVDADADAYQRFVKDHGVTFLTIRDADQKSNSLYGTVKFPETYIIDRKGVVRRKFIGPVDWNSPEVVDYLNKLSS
jgi:cytochrome c biogenesis protein CcmG/thiol:disulfide interchange protein DsbE